jgi:hypothetical protein
MGLRESLKDEVSLVELELQRLHTEIGRNGKNLNYYKQ